MVGSGVELHDAGGDGGRGAAQERAKCTSPPFVGDHPLRLVVTDMSSEPARERRLRRPRGGPHASRRAACVELEEDEEKDFVPEDSQDVEYGVMPGGTRGD